MPGFGSSDLMIKEFKNASLFYLVLAGALHAANATAFLVTARKDDTRNWIEAGFGAGQTALSVVLLGFVLRIAKKLRDNLDVDKIAANFDGAPPYTTEAKIELKSTGEIIIEKETSSIQIDSGGNILLTTAGEIKLKSNSINAQDAQKVMMGAGGALTIG